MNPCVILNPVAGSVRDLDQLKKQIERLEPSAIHLTHSPGEATRLAGEAVRQGCDFLVAAGGDGTLNEIVNGVAQNFDTIRLGLIPLGTGNDFARSLNLPAGVEENVDLLRAGKTREIDLARIRTSRSRYYINVSVGGLSESVDEKLNPEIKRTWGPLAYVRSAAAAFPELHAHRTTVELDDGEKLSLDLYNVIVANGRYVGGGLPIAPEADLSDKLLDLILIPKASTAEMLILAAQMVLGSHLKSQHIVYRRARRIWVEAEPGVWFNADGELLGNEPAEFEIMPAALHFVVP